MNPETGQFPRPNAETQDRSPLEVCLVVLACGCADVFKKPNQPKMSRVWYNFAPEQLWAEVAPGGTGRWFPVERVVTHLMMAHGWTMTEGAAPQGAIAYQLRQKEAHKSRGMPENRA